jgi:hypothetical protein
MNPWDIVSTIAAICVGALTIAITAAMIRALINNNKRPPRNHTRIL